MPEIATNALAIVCRSEADADLLKQQLHNQGEWCGLWILNQGPIRKHGLDTVLILSYGGQLKKRRLPKKVTRVDLYESVAELGLVKQAIRRARKTGKPSRGLAATILFKRKRRPR